MPSFVSNVTNAFAKRISALHLPQNVVVKPAPAAINVMEERDLARRLGQHVATRGKEKVEAIVESGRTRFRPIVMTTTAMIAGMLPLALALEPAPPFASASASS